MRLRAPQVSNKSSTARGKLAHMVLAGFLALGTLGFAILFFDTSGQARGNEAAVVSTLPASVVSIDYSNCHFGTGQVYRSIMSYSVSSLNLGWYLNWAALGNPPRPGGIEYAQMLHVSDGGYSPSGSALANRIALNPGSLWLVGNEPDCIFQDNVLPQTYAQVYHDAYAFIKSHDPTARVAAGGIVQPTPLRMEYLDSVLDIFVSLYGQPLPTDAWSIHSFILREASCAVYPDACWGAEIPPGISAIHGMLYDLEETDSLSIFQQRIAQFRSWMSDRGYRNTPLIITEYGTLVPHIYTGWDEERAKVFMYGTFDFLRAAQDANTGYPPDENRLVQQWMWYSLDDEGYGGTLFNRFTLEKLKLGAYFGDYTGALTPTIDLFAIEVGQASPVPYSPADPTTVTLQLRFSNVGNIATAQPITVRFLDGADNQLGSDQIISDTIAGCAAVRTITIPWANVTPGAHVVQAVIDPANTLAESNEHNNQAYGVILVAKHQVFLPVISRRR